MALPGRATADGGKSIVEDDTPPRQLVDVGCLTYFVFVNTKFETSIVRFRYMKTNIGYH